MRNSLFWLISAFYFWFFAIIGVYVIYMPKILQLHGYTSWQIGLIFALSPLMRFLTPFLFLRHLQLTQPLYRLSLLLGLLAGGLFFSTINNFWLFMTPNILLGISFALSLPFVETIALATIGKERYGRSRLFGSLGFIVVALLLARWMDDPQITLWTLLITLVMTTIVGFFIQSEHHFDNPKQKAFNLFKEWRLWVNILLMQISFGPFYNFFTIYESERGLDYTTISYLWTFGVVAEIIMLFFQAPLLRKNLLWIITFCTFAAAVRWLLIFLFPTSLAILFFAQSLHALSFALYYSAVISYLFAAYTNKTLAQQFFGGISFGLGGMLGSLFAGIVYGKYLFFYASLVALAAFLVLVLKPAH